MSHTANTVTRKTVMIYDYTERQCAASQSIYIHYSSDFTSGSCVVSPQRAGLIKGSSLTNDATMKHGAAEEKPELANGFIRQAGTKQMEMCEKRGEERWVRRCGGKDGGGKMAIRGMTEQRDREAVFLSSIPRGSSGLLGV